MSDQYSSYADTEYGIEETQHEYLEEETVTGGRVVRARYAGSAVAVAGEQLDREVQRAQEQLLVLKRQQEQIEKQKRELEELARQQDELDQGKRELTDKLTRALVTLDRLSNDSQLRVEQSRATIELFNMHLRALDDIEPQEWATENLPRELSRALGMVDTARRDFSQARARILSDHPESAEEGEALDFGDASEANAKSQADKDFNYWLRAGFAFTLPIVILGFTALLVYCWANFTFKG